MNVRSLGLGITLVAVVLAVLIPVNKRAPGCALVFGTFANARLSEESAIIVWDAPKQMQHFIRRASFQVRGDQPRNDFGFLVPTPALPELAEAADAAFATLAALMQRRETIHTYRWQATLCTPIQLLGSNATSTFTAVESNVTVLHRQNVAGYDAVVLEATDAKALNDWLGKHGYVARPGLVEWLEPYVQAKWKITAFKLAEPAPAATAAQLARSLATRPVRMSFPTPQPFFPYREPAEPRSAATKIDLPEGRSMHVLFLGAGRVKASLGTDAPRPWPARVPWTNALPSADLAVLRQQLDLGVEQLPDATWLTAFEDHTGARPDMDVYFETDDEQTPIVPPPLVIPREIPIPIDIISGMAVLMILCIRAARLSQDRATTSNRA
jgi:hypothetical protein